MRLFVAIELEPDLKEAMLSLRDQLEGLSSSVRWIPESNLHLTLKFLGEVTEERAVEVRKALGSAVLGWSSFELSFVRFGCFPKRGPVRIVWAGVESPSGEIEACAARVEDALFAVGFEREERAFSPHVTIGRIKSDPSQSGLRSAVEQAQSGKKTQGISAVSLFLSELKKTGAQYSLVERFSFTV